MIKSMKKIFILVVTITLAFGIMSLNYSNAGEGSISISPAKAGQEFTVTVSVPIDAVGYNGKIAVTFSNGETVSSGVLAKVTGIDGDFTHPGNMTFTLKAPVAGNATVKVTELTLSGKSGEKLNGMATLEQGFTVEAANAAPAPAQPTPAAPATDAGHTATNDIVYTTEKLNIRKGNSANTDKLGTLDKDSKIKRISKGSDGWDKIEYNGGAGYVLSKYLTTQSPEERAKTEPKWTEKTETVYSTAKVNVRKGWGTTFDVMGGLKVGQEVKRIAKGDNGWDKIEYDGETGYVMSKLLTTDKSKADELLAELEKENENNTVENTTADNNTVANNIVENTMTKEEIYNTIVDEIGVVPQVGNSTGGYIYYISVTIAMIMVAIVGLKIRSKNGNEE